MYRGEFHIRPYTWQHPETSKIKRWKEEEEEEETRHALSVLNESIYDNLII
jgi:hypothetical protein